MNLELWARHSHGLGYFWIGKTEDDATAGLCITHDCHLVMNETFMISLSRLDHRMPVSQARCLLVVNFIAEVKCIVCSQVSGALSYIQIYPTVFCNYFTTVYLHFSCLFMFRISEMFRVINLTACLCNSLLVWQNWIAIFHAQLIIFASLN